MLSMSTYPFIFELGFAFHFPKFVGLSLLEVFIVLVVAMAVKVSVQRLVHGLVYYFVLMRGMSVHRCIVLNRRTNFHSFVVNRPCNAKFMILNKFFGSFVHSSCRMVAMKIRLVFSPIGFRVRS